MKVRLIGGLVLMGIVAFALIGVANGPSTTWWMGLNAVGMTTMHELVGSGHTKICETIINSGSLQVSKQVTTQPAADGMEVFEQKYVSGVGVTYFEQCAVIGGLNWQTNPCGGWYMGDPRDVSTAYIYEEIHNTGTVEIDKKVYSAGDWHLDEHKAVSGTGNTRIEKEVGWWSNCNRDLPEDRAEMYINLGFESANTCLYDSVWNKDGLGPQPGVPFYRCEPGCPEPYAPINTYNSVITTIEDFDYWQHVIVNP